MKFCGKCGTKIEDNIKFCPGCGSPADAPQEQQSQQAQPQQTPPPQQNQNSFGEMFQNLNNTADTTAEFDQNDINTNKGMAILAYFGPLVFIPMFAAKQSKFARYHSNQGLLLLITAVAWSIVYGIINAILLAISWRLYTVSSIIGILSIVFFVLFIIGIINASNGRAKELPIIGKFKILK